MKLIAGACAAVALSATTLFAQAQAPVRPQTGTEKVTPAAAAQAGNLMEDITTVGCVREWKPAPDDPTKFPESRQPGMYLLTPVASNPRVSADLPTYLLTPTMNVNFAAHLNDKVEVVGVAQTAPLPPTVQETVTAPTMRPEERPSVQSLPRLTVRTLKKISDACPS
jgi:hypothetical protein